MEEIPFNPLSGEVKKTPPFLFSVPEVLRDEIEKIERFCEERLLLELPPTTKLLGSGVEVQDKETLQQAIEKTPSVEETRKVLSAAVSPGIRFYPEQLTSSSFLDLGYRLSRHFVSGMVNKLSGIPKGRLVRGKPSLVYGKAPDGKHFVYLSLAVGVEPV